MIEYSSRGASQTPIQFTTYERALRNARDIENLKLNVKIACDNAAAARTTMNEFVASQKAQGAPLGVNLAVDTLSRRLGMLEKDFVKGVASRVELRDQLLDLTATVHHIRDAIYFKPEKPSLRRFVAPALLWAASLASGFGAGYLLCL